MKTEKENKTPGTEETLPQGCKEFPWPQRGRLVFGPWCLLGAWPAFFGVVEKVEDQGEAREPEHRKP